MCLLFDFSALFVSVMGDGDSRETQLCIIAVSNMKEENISFTTKVEVAMSVSYTFSLSII